LQFKYWLAAKLHMTVRRMTDEMDCVEYRWWACHFALKATAEAKAAEKAKRKQRGKGTF
jgi:hypothetical protein